MKSKYFIFILTIVFMLTTISGCSHKPSKDSKDIYWIVLEKCVSDETLKAFNDELKKDGYDFKLKLVVLNDFEKPYKDLLADYLDKGGRADIISNTQSTAESPIDYPAQFIIDGNFISFDKFNKKDVDILLGKGTNVEWNRIKYNDKIYSIPDTALGMQKYGYIFNKNKVQSIPNNIDINSIAESAKQYGLIIPSIYRVEDIGGYILEDSLISAVFADDKNGDIDNLYNKKSFIDMMELLNKLNKDGYIKKYSDIDLSKIELTALPDDVRMRLNNYPKDAEMSFKFNEKTSSLSMDLFAANIYSVALMDCSLLDMSLYKDSFVEIPSFIESNINASVGIYSKSKNPDEAFKLLFLANTNSKYSDLLLHGIEGVDYKKENGYINKGDDFSHMNTYVFGNFLESTPTTNNPKEFEQRKEAFNNAVPSPYIGFNFNPKGYEDIISKVDKIAYDNLDIWKSDNLDAELERVRRELSAAGVDKLTEEVRRQVEEWKKIVE